MAQTHYMFVMVEWIPGIREFKVLRLRIKPMSDLKPIFALAGRGERMRIEVEQSQSQGQVLIQYLTTNTSTIMDETSIAWTLSGEWERDRNIQLELELERKCLGGHLSAMDDFYRSMLNQNIPRIQAQEMVEMAIQTSSRR
ncbi:hypothetical protein FIBSPDRAFT_884663 [Athelia psychrophila]|uniref:Uncharacterized protein n=1 Tax=Athelia psychrophila TaxID=1759441 RepID=A0A166SZM5_9AGAM|nr:hypothetical protein FIBSPDRAFT_884663 [Fibularhizoctonia sp. CBS 109695]